MFITHSAHISCACFRLGERISEIKLLIFRVRQLALFSNNTRQYAYALHAGAEDSAESSEE